VDALPEGPDWLFEVKFDGYRALAAASGDHVRIYTRSGKDWTDRYPAIARAIAALKLDRALLDGEVVAIDRAGRSDFGALQQALSEGLGGLIYFLSSTCWSSVEMISAVKRLPSARNGCANYWPACRGLGRWLIPTMSSATGARCIAHCAKRRSRA
jgi:hypothetical protein